jgi:hypothetical protein
LGARLSQRTIRQVAVMSTRAARGKDHTGSKTRGKLRGAHCPINRRTCRITIIRSGKKILASIHA